MVEENASSFWALDAPYSGTPVEQQDDQWVDRMNAYYDGVGEYLQETDEIVGEGD